MLTLDELRKKSWNAFKHVLFTIFAGGGIISNGGLTLFGTLKSYEYFLEIDWKDPDELKKWHVLIPTLGFMVATMIVIGINRSPSIYNTMFPIEEKKDTPSENKSTPPAVKNRSTHATIVSTVFKGLGLVSTAYFSVGTYLNARTIYAYFQALITHQNHLNFNSEDDVRDWFASMIALAAIIQFLSYNIKRNNQGADAIGDMIDGETYFKAHALLEEKEKKEPEHKLTEEEKQQLVYSAKRNALIVLGISSVTGPALAYLSTTHSLAAFSASFREETGDPNHYARWGAVFSVTPYITTNFNSRALAYFRKFFYIRDILPEKESPFLCFLVKPWNVLKNIVYSMGRIDNIGTVLGVWVGFVHAVNDYHGEPITNNWKYVLNVIGAGLGVAAADINFEFSVTSGFHDAVKFFSRRSTQPAAIFEEKRDIEKGINSEGPPAAPVVTSASQKESESDSLLAKNETSSTPSAFHRFCLSFHSQPNGVDEIEPDTRSWCTIA